MKMYSKIALLSGALMLLTCLSGPEVLGESATNIVGGDNGSCVVDMPCHSYCTGAEMYTVCDTPAPDSAWCMQFGWSPCGEFEDCVELTVAMGTSCWELDE